MPRRKELLGVAATIADRWMSRNNDINGYWAPGVLYKEASENGVKQLTLNILTGLASPGLNLAGVNAVQLHDFYLQHLKNRGFEEHQVLGAMIEILFNVPAARTHIKYMARSAKKDCLPDGTLLSTPRYTSHGDPFICRVTLIDDLNKSYCYDALGVCRKYDPRLETRSLRAKCAG